MNGFVDVMTRARGMSLALACCLAVTACSGPPSSAPSASSPGTASAGPLIGPSVAPSMSPTVVESPLPAGMSRLTGFAIGSPHDSPRFTVLAPAGWRADGFILSIVDPVVAGIGVWMVGDVPTDPCHWRGTFVTPGPTVDDLVDVLVTQRLRNASTPVDVTLAGYSGKYLEWSVPDDMVVTGDAEFRGCDATAEGYNDFISWHGQAGGSRYHQALGQTDRLWILDVDGQTLVVDAAYGPDTPVAVRDQLAAIVETLEFVAP